MASRYEDLYFEEEANILTERWRTFQIRAKGLSKTIGTLYKEIKVRTIMDTTTIGIKIRVESLMVTRDGRKEWN